MTLQADPSRETPTLVIQQPALPRYRAPLFKAIAANTRISFLLVYGSEAPALQNVEPDGFNARYAPSYKIRLPLLGLFFWHSPQWQLASGRDAQLLILSANTRCLSLLPALLRARFNKVPVAIWGHGYSKSPARWRNWLRRIPMSLANATLLYDPATKNMLADEGVSPAKLFVAANGLDRQSILAAQTSWLESPEKLQTFREDHGLNTGPVIIHLSRLQQANRLDIAIDALPELTAALPDIRLVVIGDGAEEKLRLQTLAKKLNVESHIHWVGGVYNESALAPWMLSADVFVYPQNAGLSLIHGFNYRLPAVLCGPAQAHNPEFSAFSDGVNGRLAARAAAPDFAQAVVELLGSPDTCRAMAKQAFATAEKQYNIETMATNFAQLIDTLLTQRSVEPASGE